MVQSKFLKVRWQQSLEYLKINLNKNLLLLLNQAIKQEDLLMGRYCHACYLAEKNNCSHYQ